MSFETITQGPINTTGANPQATPNGLSLDQKNNIVSSVGSAGTERTFEAVLAVVNNAAAITAVTTAQTLLTVPQFNAYLLNKVNRILRLRGWLVYSTTITNVATLTFALKLGTVTLASIATGASNTAASANLPVEFEFLLRVAATGVYGAVAAHGVVRAELGAAATTAVTTYLDNNIDSIQTMTVATNPVAGDTITVNGTLVTFIANAATPVGNQVALGTTATLTATAIYTFLAASADTNIAKSTWTNPSNGVVVGTSNTAGLMPSIGTSVPAKITFSNPTVDLTAVETLTVTLAGSAAIPSAQLLLAVCEVVA